MYNILFYEDERGNKPVESFIDMLDAAALTNKGARIQLEQIIYCLNRLEDRGTRAGEKFTKRISGDIWELRPGNNRILSLDGMEITLFFYITSLRLHKRHLQGKSKLLANGWITGYREKEGVSDYEKLE